MERKVEKNKSKEFTFNGLGVSPGIAIGVAYVRECSGISVPEYGIAINQVKAEQERFSIAVKKAYEQLSTLHDKTRNLSANSMEELGYLLDAYKHMLKGSRLTRGVISRIKTLRINAEAALQAEIADISASFLSMNDSYLAQRADDIYDIGNRVMRNLLDDSIYNLTHIPQNSIVIADEITPADAAQMDPRLIKGFATVSGGAEGHTAIMARALTLPAVLGITGLTSRIRSGHTVIVDGSYGRVIVNPCHETIEYYQHKNTELLREQRALIRLKRRPSITRDGVDITLQANIELPIELSQAHQYGASGIGLLRSEFFYMNRTDLPDEEEQYEILRGLVEGMKGKMVTVRTLDIGGEKIVKSLVDKVGASATSVLGLRGIRLSLNQKSLFATQIAAILRAGVHGPVRILLPMVTMVSEVRRARKEIKRVAQRLKKRGVTIDKLPPLGIMIEVPGAALAADTLAVNADFFAIGSNDLTMYSLATDRSDKRVAHLYDPLHPAILRLIQFSTAAALRAHIPVSLCGEMAGDPRYSSLLLGLGIRELSMSPHNIARVKRRIREMDMVAATARASLILEQIDSGRIATLLDDFNALA